MMAATAETDADAAAVGRGRRGGPPASVAVRDGGATAAATSVADPVADDSNDTGARGGGSIGKPRGEGDSCVEAGGGTPAASTPAVTSAGNSPVFMDAAAAVAAALTGVTRETVSIGRCPEAGQGSSGGRARPTEDVYGSKWVGGKRETVLAPGHADVAVNSWGEAGATVAGAAASPATGTAAATADAAAAAAAAVAAAATSATVATGGVAAVS